jgi:hypothetical protein
VTTTVDPVYKSKEQYQKLLRKRVALLSLQQHLIDASNCYAVLLMRLGDTQLQAIEWYQGPALCGGRGEPVTVTY